MSRPEIAPERVKQDREALLEVILRKIKEE
jgi:hypothetical protein